MFNFVHIACFLAFLTFVVATAQIVEYFFALVIGVLPTVSSVFVAASVSGPFGAEAVGADVVVCVVCVRCVNALWKKKTTVPRTCSSAPSSDLPTATTPSRRALPTRPQ